MLRPGDRLSLNICSFFRVSLLLVWLVNAATPEKSGSAIGDYVPLVIWHGMGDSCCFSMGVGGLKNYLQQQFPQMYIKSLQIGSSLQGDSFNSFFLNANTQVEMVCAELSVDSELKNGFNAIGFSQGAQLLRALIQRCAEVKVHNLLSIGGQHQGVFGFPFCPGETSYICHAFRRFLTIGSYLTIIQDYLVQAQYWHDPYDELEYKVLCNFLPDINQELQFKQEYRDRFSNISNLVLVKFLQDGMVQPPETSWFGFYKEGQSVETYSMFESTLYKKDLLGLRYLYTTGRLHLLSYPGDHLRYSKQWLVDTILPYINRTWDNVRDPLRPSILPT